VRLREQVRIAAPIVKKRFDEVLDRPTQGRLRSGIAAAELDLPLSYATLATLSPLG
jgi:hypothetical protein